MTLHSTYIGRGSCLSCTPGRRLSLDGQGATEEDNQQAPVKPCVLPIFWQSTNPSCLIIQWQYRLFQFLFTDDTESRISSIPAPSTIPPQFCHNFSTDVPENIELEWHGRAISEKHLLTNPNIQTLLQLSGTKIFSKEHLVWCFRISCTISFCCKGDYIVKWPPSPGTFLHLAHFILLHPLPPPPPLSFPPSPLNCASGATSSLAQCLYNLVKGFSSLEGIHFSGVLVNTKKHMIIL